MSEHLDQSALDGKLADLCDAPHWYVGFSGGVDSTALLHLLTQWCKVNPHAPPLTAIHINHGLQSQAQDWEIHCGWVCKFLHIPFRSFTVAVQADGKGQESAARDARYQAFERQLGPGDVLFLAHHLDDQVETFFLRLMRGAGVRGLAAMPRERILGQGRIVRPLLDTPRGRLEMYVGHCGLDCIEDPSNSDTAMDRNFLRAELLPLVAKRWPGYRHTVSRASEHLAGAAKALEETVPRPRTVVSALGDPGISLTSLGDVPPEAAAVVLRSWLQGCGRQAPDQAALMEFLRQLRESSEQASPRLQCSAYALQRFGSAVYLLPAETPEPPEAIVEFRPGECLELPGVGAISLEEVTDQGLQLSAGERLQLTWRQGGERCQPVGRDSSTSLKKLLQERDVPPWWRARVPLLYLGDELLAVGDLWPCASSRWRDDSPRRKRLYQLRWQPALEEGFD